jgi:hypothetical protein
VLTNGEILLRKYFDIPEKKHVAILSKIDWSTHFILTCTYYESWSKHLAIDGDKSHTLNFTWPNLLKEFSW